MDAMKSRDWWTEPGKTVVTSNQCYAQRSRNLGRTVVKKTCSQTYFARDEKNTTALNRLFT